MKSMCDAFPLARVLCVSSVFLGCSHSVLAQTCTAAVSTIAFGSVSPVRNTAINTTGTITVSCTWTSAVTFNQAQVCLNLTGGTPRSMLNGSKVLQYGLYSDSAHTVAWGATSAGTTPISTQLTRPGISGTTTQTVSVYGQVPAAQTTVKTVSNATTVYSEAIAGASTSLNYRGYTLGLLPACSQLSSNGTFSFSANASVINDCIVGATNVAFGSSAGPLSSAISANGTISVQCTNGDAYEVSLSSGNSGSLANREMKSVAGNLVNYQLYLDAAHTMPWGDGTSGSSASVGTGSGAVQSLTVYGVVPAQTSAAPGSYSDTITATINF
jgi:spore coat protein U-like protein